MPIYEFKCKNCGRVFEVLFRTRQEQLKVLCPDCRSEKAERVMSVFGSKVEKDMPSAPPCAATCSDFK
ncbi:MAG: zinc ribbon domain-containing protein [Syntrophobacterales bacterium]|nr:zinc ribbon domain-containing protein [Syntrophobacterales bacterium]